MPSRDDASRYFFRRRQMAQLSTSKQSFTLQTTATLILYLSLKSFIPRLSVLLHIYNIMPPIRSARNRKPPPDGFDDIEDTLLEFSNKMKDAENASHEGKKRHEVLWPIFQISHQRKWFFTRSEALCFHIHVCTAILIA